MVVVANLVGADVLRDPAGLAGSDLGLTNGVEQRRLAVIDVAHDRDHRRPLDEVLVGVVEHRLGDRLVLGVDDLHLFVELDRQQLDRVVRQRLGQRRISPSTISFLMISEVETSTYSATSLTVEPELIWTAV